MFFTLKSQFLMLFFLLKVKGVYFMNIWLANEFCKLGKLHDIRFASIGRHAYDGLF